MDMCLGPGNPCGRLSDDPGLWLRLDKALAIATICGSELMHGRFLLSLSLLAAILFQMKKIFKK